MTGSRMRESRSDTQQRNPGRESNPGPLQSLGTCDARSTHWVKRRPAAAAFWQECLKSSRDFSWKGAKSCGLHSTCSACVLCYRYSCNALKGTRYYDFSKPDEWKVTAKVQKCEHDFPDLKISVSVASHLSLRRSSSLPLNSLYKQYSQAHKQIYCVLLFSVFGVAPLHTSLEQYGMNLQESNI